MKEDQSTYLQGKVQTFRKLGPKTVCKIFYRRSKMKLTSQLHDKVVRTREGSNT